MNTRNFWTVAISGIASLMIMSAVFAPVVADWLRLAFVVVGALLLLAAHPVLSRENTKSVEIDWTFSLQHIFQSSILLKAVAWSARPRAEQRPNRHFPGGFKGLKGWVNVQTTIGIVVEPDAFPAMTASGSPYYASRAQIAARHFDDWLASTPLPLRATAATAATGS